MRKQSEAELRQICGVFNERYPVGHQVMLRKDSGEEIVTKIKREAEVLSGHSAVIWLEGVSGCYLLDRVTPLAHERSESGQTTKPFEAAALRALLDGPCARTSVTNPVNGTAPYTTVIFLRMYMDFSDGQYDLPQERDAGSGKAAACAQEINNAIAALARTAAELATLAATEREEAARAAGFAEGMERAAGIADKSAVLADRVEVINVFGVEAAANYVKLAEGIATAIRAAITPPATPIDPPPTA